MEKREEPVIRFEKNAPTGKKRILIIDDNADVLYLVETILAMYDYEPVTAFSGRQALVILSEIDAPDLILLDMQMEDMSGPEFLQILDEKRPEIVKNVPVVFLTGMDKAPASKAVGFIRKPFDFDKFLAAVHRFIEMGTGRSQYKH